VPLRTGERGYKNYLKLPRFQTATLTASAIRSQLSFSSRVFLSKGYPSFWAINRCE
jgi:hypothetical protein